MKRTALALTLILALLFSAVAGSQFVNLTLANPIASKSLPEILIRSDGSIYPLTPLMYRVGNVYTLTDSIRGTYAIVVYCSNIVIDGKNHMIDGEVAANYGITLSIVTNVTVKNIEIHRFNAGVAISSSSNCTIARANMTNNGYGVWLLNSQYNNITENNIDHNGWGINVGTSNFNNIYGNNIMLNYEKGIVLINSLENNVYGNNIMNQYYGIHIEKYNLDDAVPEPRNNKIYLNNFINNTLGQVYFHVISYANFWDNNKQGNYWSNYNGTDENADGIYDTPYIINANNQDNYPLMQPVDILRVLDAKTPSISIISPENKTHATSNVTLTFTISESTSLISYSLDKQDNITITGNTTLAGLSSGSHCVTIYAKDKVGNIGVSETVYFSITEPFPTTLVIAVLIASLVIVSAGLLVYLKKRKH